MKKKIALIFVIIATIVLTCFNVSCGSRESNNQTVPNTNVTNVSDTEQNVGKGETAKEQTIAVYNTELQTVTNMDLEDYVMGVVAGEMFNSWENEALKAQAVLARTYTMYFKNNSTSKYKGADISTDITEAQAYNTSNINDAIKKAVNETRGKVLKYDGEFINAWFHSNSGGKTTTAKVGQNYTDDEPKYIKSVSSPENVSNSENFEWKISLKKTDVLNALRKMGVSISNISSFEIVEKSEDGRAKTFIIGNKEVNANTFRLNYGSTKLKSTLITKITLGNSSVEISGKGYGHGVGMSQWGAQIMAKDGKNYEEILKHYFANVNLETI